MTPTANALRAVRLMGKPPADDGGGYHLASGPGAVKGGRRAPGAARDGRHAPLLAELPVEDLADEAIDRDRIEADAGERDNARVDSPAPGPPLQDPVAGTAAVAPMPAALQDLPHKR